MSDLEEEYRLDYFAENGFQRMECVECGDHFWTRDESRETCGEPPCAEYGFIDDPGFDEEYSLAEMRETFLSFFEEHGHERIDPYPVAANRWRDDVLLTQASIYDFQPLVTSGTTPPPANPLTISQPCIRMQDIDNVGKTGRHTMAFEMMAHHAFNAREDADEEYAYEGEVYWKDATVEHCDTLLAELGADPAEITYIEDPWVGGGNAGPAIEVIYRGLELATLVFMSMEQDPDGEFLMKDGNHYSKMDTYVVDTGYGLERWTWMSQGTPTVYEAIYPEMIDFLTDNAGIDHTDEEAAIVHDAARLAGNLDIDDVDDVEAARGDIAAELGVDVDRLRELVEPLEDIYAIADHCRTLAYMLGDGIVPSNVGTGYLARMVLRRTKRLADGVGVDAPLDELVDMQAERLDYENRDTVRDVVRTEVEKYRETLDRGRRRVEQLAEQYRDRDEPIPADELVELYDSHGIQPDMVEDIAGERDVEVSVPDDFYSVVAQRHAGEDDADEDETTTVDTERIADLPDTERLYYENQDRFAFEAMVLEVFEREEGYEVVLDQTMFYPEGGGQPADHGTLSGDDVTVDVTDVQRSNGVILHRTDGDPGKGEFVRGQVDGTRRSRLMRHHTATHIVGHAARQVLGEHIRQAGAQKHTDSARLDVKHYESITREEVKEIERIANDVVTANASVSQEWIDRNEA
ncbi:MAG: alanyl-tRNA synthetase, partial [Haloarculaceae archaeon]